MAKRTKIFPYVLRRVKELNIKNHGELTCDICGLPIGSEPFQFDHIIPVSKYDKARRRFRMNSIHNLQISHSKCNLNKSNI